MTAPASIEGTWLGLPWWGWLSLTYLAYVWWTWKHPRLWIPLDVKDFEADGSKQSLGYVFHRQRATWRFIGAVVPALLAILPLVLHFHPRWYACLLPLVGLVSAHGGYWVWYFNPNLSRARNLDYIDPWHVSWAANAAWIDRHVWREAWEKVYESTKSHQFEFVPGEYDAAVALKSREIYPKILRELLWTGLGWGILTHFFFFLIYHG